MMSSPPVPRRRLARQLRAMRDSAGLSLVEAAQKLDLSKSALGRIEVRQTQATVHIIRSMMDLYNQYQPDVLDMVRQARVPGWWQGYRIANVEYLAWETCADTVRELAVARIPDLLQTEPYAQAWLSVDSCEEPDPYTVRRRVNDEAVSRVIRQERFTGSAPLRLAAVIAETALPETGWGELALGESRPAAGKRWTDSGEVHDRRGLKHRAEKERRFVPIPPVLVQILREHVERYGTGPDGRLFRSPNGGVVGSGTYSHVWDEARRYALSPDQVASPLAGRTYDLRHAAVSLWLNGGIPAPEVAARAGHSVDVLLKVYAKCIYGQRDSVNKKIEGLYGDEAA